MKKRGEKSQRPLGRAAVPRSSNGGRRFRTEHRDVLVKYNAERERGGQNESLKLAVAAAAPRGREWTQNGELVSERETAGEGDGVADTPAHVAHSQTVEFLSAQETEVQYYTSDGKHEKIKLRESRK